MGLTAGRKNAKILLMLRKKNQQLKTHTDIDYGLPELNLGEISKHKQTVSEKLAELAKMDDLQFEHYMARLFALQGYEVRYTPVENDCGADLVISRGNETIAVRCLLGSGVLDKDAVESALGAMRHYSVHKVMIVTNMMFSAQAIRFARKTPVVLVDRPALIEDYLKMKVKLFD